MDEEAKIARHLAERNLPQTDDVPAPTAPVPEPDAPDPDAFHNNLPIDNSVLKYDLLSYFDLNVGAMYSGEVQDQVNLVLEWAKENAGEQTIGSVLQAIHHQEQVLGTTLKQDRLYRMYQFVKLFNARKNIEDKMVAYGFA